VDEPRRIAQYIRYIRGEDTGTALLTPALNARLKGQCQPGVGMAHVKDVFRLILAFDFDGQYLTGKAWKGRAAV